MDIYDQHEQGERVRSWLKENGSSILFGVVGGLGLIFGYQQWVNYQARQAYTAAELYQRSVQPEAEAAATATTREQLRNDFPKSGFAFLAALEEAHVQAGAGEFDAARASLEWVRSQTSEPALKALAGLRLAQIELAQGHADKALVLLDALPADDFAALRAEQRGDALLALGRPDEARSAYQLAQESGPADPARIEMKLAEFPATVAETETGDS